MPFVRRAMGRSRLCRGVLAVQRHEAARICCANLVARPCVGCLRRFPGAGEALRWLASASPSGQNPSNVFARRAGCRAHRKRRRATLQRCKLSADTYFSSLARFRCRRSASVSWCRERSHWLHTKCINSGAKPAYCAAKHINHSSDQRSNEAPATNDAVVPRARR